MVMSVHNTSIDRKRKLNSTPSSSSSSNRFAFDEMTLNKKKQKTVGSSSNDNHNNNNKLVNEFSEKMCATYVKAAFDSLEKVCIGITMIWLDVHLYDLTGTNIFRTILFKWIH